MNWQLFWQRKGLLNYLLLPLSGLFYLVSTIRRYSYHLGVFKSYRAPCPVVVIGNINVGGAGKTPLVIALGRLLKDAGIRYAVISRGYGGRYKNAMLVDSYAAASVVGDEPALIHAKLACPVVVAKKRRDACELILKKHPQIQVIISDDGLQHYALARDIEVCVVNATTTLGNGWLLPAGGLRELPGRLHALDFVVSNGDSNQPYHYQLFDVGWQHIRSGKNRQHHEFSHDKGHNLCLSGIAHPQAFFSRVRALGITAEVRAFPDHHRFKQADLPDDKTLLMTEKDSVKIKALNHEDAWFLKVEAQLSTAFRRHFLAKIQSLLIVH